MQINKLFQKIIIFSIALMPFFITQPVLAQSGWSEYNGNLPADPNNPGAATFESVDTIFSNILGLIMPLAGIVIFIMFIIGGYRLMFAGGDPQKTALAQGTLTWAIIGLLFLLGSWFILSLIHNFTGVDVTHFSAIIFPAP